MATYYRADGWVKSVLGQAIAGASIYICTQPADTSYVPPVPLAQIYSDPAGLSPITQPILTDGFGHYDYYAATGTAYTEVVVNGGKTQAVYQDQIPMGATLGGGGGGAVSSVFGRTGDVLATTGDYNVSQITGAAPTASPTFTGTVQVANEVVTGTIQIVNAYITGTLRDGTGSVGTAGQVLSSTVSGTAWVNASSGGGTSCPSLASFTFINQGTSTAIQNGTSSGPILMTVADSASLNWRGLFVNQPATPYKVITQIRLSTAKGFVNSQTGGVYFYNGTKFMGLEVLLQSTGALARVEKINNINTDGSTVASLGSQSTSVAYAIPLQAPFWIQLRNSGSTIYFDYGFDGSNFINLYSESVGTFITPTMIGWGGLSATNDVTNFLMNDLMNWTTVGNANL
jgi:hypothetical protein